MGRGKAVPVDLLFDILRLLPVKSLRRFELVSKSWCSLIHDPLFINSHFRRAADTNSCSALVTFCNLAYVLFSGTEFPANFAGFSFPKHRIPLHVLSCNGLNCFPISSAYVIIITNLLSKATDYHITSIPRMKFTWRKPTDTFYGFGYDSTNDDYKVLIVRNRKHDTKSAQTCVYSLRRNEWSPIKRRFAVGNRQPFPVIVNNSSMAFITSAGVAASGALHWVAKTTYYDFAECLILAFNLTTEEFYEMSLPDNVRGEMISKQICNTFCLGVLQEALCFSTYARPEEPYHEIWVMRDYNVHTSWTKLFQVASYMNYPCPLSPLMYSKSDHRVLLVAEYYGCFYWYDLEKRKLIECCRNPTPKRVFYTPAVCLDSLKSVSDYKALWGQGSSSRGRKRKTKDDNSSSMNKQRPIAIKVEDEAQALEYFALFRNQFNRFMSKP